MYRLIITPQLDDETICLGGSISKWVEAGDRVEVLPLFNDDTVCNGLLVTASLRRMEFERAMRILGAVPLTPVFAGLGYEDNSHKASIGESIRRVENHLIAVSIREFCGIYFPSVTEHQDHLFANKVGEVLMRASSNFRMCNFYEYPLPYRAFDNVLSGIYIDVEEYLQDKSAALMEYKTQMRGSGNMSINGILEFNQTLGRVFGLDKALEKVIVRRMMC